MLGEHGGSLGYILWRTLVDAQLWQGAKPQERRGLFRSPDTRAHAVLALALHDAPELEASVRTLFTPSSMPEVADQEELATACGAIVEWAEGNGLKETALQYAELGARLQPESAPRAFTAGRLARRLGDAQRAATWYWRSIRLARRANNNIDRANGHLGLGNLEHGSGRYSAAEAHFWKAARAALRNGRKSLAAAAFHNLVGVAYETGQKAVALDHLRKAAEFYTADHPRFPAFAYDAGFFLLREGYFSSALLVFEKVLPWVDGDPQIDILTRSAYARAAAAVRDHIRYQRTTNIVLSMIATDVEGAANALYHLAEGARCFMDWDRAYTLGSRALELARGTDAPTAEFAESLLQAIHERAPGDVDRVPPDGDPVDRTTQEIMRKLTRRNVPNARPVPPERYPTD